LPLTGRTRRCSGGIASQLQSTHLVAAVAGPLGEFSSKMTALEFMLLAVGVYLTVAWATTCWFFRDGLGPGSITSTGNAALSRFWEGFRLSLIVTIPLGVIGGCCMGLVPSSLISWTVQFIFAVEAPT